MDHISNRKCIRIAMATNPFKYLQWLTTDLLSVILCIGMTSLKPKLLSLSHLLFNNNIHIAAISETWLDANSQFKINGFNVFCRDRPDSYGGVAILTHKSIKAQLGDFQILNSGIEVVHVKLHNYYLLENILAIYCPPSVRTNYADCNHIFSSFYKKSIIVGDLNAHHTNWSCKTDSRGIQVLDSLIDNRFIILNNGNTTRIKLVNGVLHQSSPDLSLATSDIAIKFNWHVLNETLGSDHSIIQLSSECRMNNSSFIKGNYKRADWSSYRDCLQELYTKLLIPEDPQKAYDIFIDYKNLATELHTPVIKISQNPASKFALKPYWNPDLSRAVAVRRLALSNFRRNPIPSNLTILQEKVRIAQKLIRQAKHKSWVNFCSSIDNTTLATDMWRKMKFSKGCRMPRSFIDPSKASELLSSLTPDYV